MQTNDSLSILPDILLARRESWDSRQYQWDNQQRKNDHAIVIQRCGNGTCFFENSERRHRVEEGQVMLFRHGENSRYGLEEDSRLPYIPEYLVLAPGGGALEIFEGLRAVHGPVLRMEESGEACQILHMLIRNAVEGQPGDRLDRAESVYCLLLALLREQRSATRASDPVAYGRHLLETRYREARNLKEWCAQIGMSREHFTRAFHERYGHPPSEFLRELRLRHAEDLLRNSRLPLEDVAVQSGFASTQTFHRAYKRRFGLSAGKDRKRN